MSETRTQGGGCRCGAIRYDATGSPQHSSLCWCGDCRASAGAPVVGWALFAQDAVTIHGSPHRHESSPGTYRDFCGTCGTGLFFYSDAIFPGLVDIQSATFDDPDAFPPQAMIQTADAPHWRDRMSALPAFDRYPPMPG